MTAASRPVTTQRRRYRVTGMRGDWLIYDTLSAKFWQAGGNRRAAEQECNRMNRAASQRIAAHTRPKGAKGMGT